MEGSSVLLCKGCTPWQWLLVTASLLTFWHLSTTADVTIESLPPLVAEGENVLFLVRDLPENLMALAWFKGLTDMKQGIAVYTLHNNLSVTGSVHSGRETIYHNGSLLLENVTQKDTGYYTLRTYNRRAKIVSTTSMYLQVHAFLWKCGRLATSAQPSIELVPPSVAEGGSVLLRIYNPPENIVGFVWFKGTINFKNVVATHLISDRKSTVWGPAYTGRETLHSDGSLLLHSVTQRDGGVYTLRVLRTDTGKEEAEVQLQVDTSLFLFCNPFTSSQIMIQPVPRYPAEGKGVLLQVHNLPEDLLTLVWYKSKFSTSVLKIVEYSRTINSISWGPEHIRRGMVYNNGSLMLQDVTEKDSGMYTLEVLKKNSKTEKAYVEFYVKKYVTQPFVQITDTTVSGGTSVIFTCISPDTDISIRWIFNNQNLQLTERMTLSPTKCGLRIDPVRNEDFGEYKCQISNRFSLKTSLPVFWPR
ncbi:pregnancy-specific glycoprotein 22-like [Peromyscus maniculatus bairdii]|uniref:Ig-like domain-containing protein n=1 Tax=Peromyscus maniculatus bairdii TaxID=230844 RepID=A0A8C8UDF4_PERMB|nr:pregnancy-specific glycoprotein 22-like [Peromyscus maniculatus bairdii]